MSLALCASIIIAQEIQDTLQSESLRYEIYMTENVYNFLRLDTQTGRITQVQWYLDERKEAMVELNTEDLSEGRGYVSGSFGLYPTKNIYQFVLMDKTDGRMWHVQWGIGGARSRWIRPIDKSFIETGRVTYTASKRNPNAKHSVRR